MATADTASKHLVEGERMSRDEFLARWRAEPGLKFAELIGGEVYMPSPLSRPHGYGAKWATYWLTTYELATPGTDVAPDVTSYMLTDAPQPNLYLRVLPEAGGQSWNEDIFVGGAPELVVEVCLSSASYDLHQKKKLYEKAGVREYLAFLIEEGKVIVFRNEGGVFRDFPSDGDGIWRSREFPGLWLDVSALVKGDLPRVLQTLQTGLATPEHAAFVQSLKERRPSEAP